jgi:Mn2+/Fe2+ NRAMP family transporter
MVTFVTMGGRLGLMQSKSVLQTVSETYGRWFAIIIGIAAFLSGSFFQFGNNLGAATALAALTGTSETIWPLLITPLAMVLVFYAKNLYKVLEKLMLGLVSIMILCFLLNLVFAGPSLQQAAAGFVPSPFPGTALDEIAAIVGTTFVLNACLYQAYLVQSKGWKMSEYRLGKRDAIAGIAILATISILITMTSAAVIHPQGIVVSNAADMAIQLEVLLGKFAKMIFSIGLFAAAFSSLVVNSVIAGGLLSDGLGMGRSMQERAPKLFTTLAMLIGMVVAVFFKGDVVYALVLAQGATLLGAPAIAIALLLLLNNKKVMGQYTNSWWHNGLAFLGLILLMLVVYQIITRLYSIFAA